MICMRYQGNLYIIKEQAFVGGACVCHGYLGGGACVCHGHKLLPQNGTCPNMPIGCRRRDDAIFYDATSPPDVYSIAVMTKSSSKVLGRFPTLQSITGR
jgi:hypothetical protein